MSDAANVWDVVLTDKDAETFLREKFEQHACRNCGHTSFSLGLVAPGGGEYLAILTVKDNGAPGTNHLPIFTAACQNCGLVETYAAGPLVNWKKAQQEAKADGDA